MKKLTERDRQTIKALIAFFILMLLFGIGSDGDYEAEIEKIDRYCEYVDRDYWPPFRGTAICRRQ